MSQTPLAIPLWEKFLTRVNFARIVEFGTQRGVLSEYFWLFCSKRKAEFFTFDVVESDAKGFMKIDIFENEKLVGEVLERSGITILFCDNGNKPREVKTFTKYIKLGDYLVVHDWNTEIFVKDIPKELKDITKESDGMLRFFIKT